MLVVIRCRLITGVANKSLLDVEVHIVPCVPQSPSGGGGGDDGQENDAPVDTDDAPPAEPEEEPVFCRNCGCGKLSETNEDGITTTRYDAAAQPMASVQKQLVSQLSGTIESKSVFVSERGLTSVQWTEYSEHTKRVQYSTVLTSSITAEVVMVDGFALSQKDTAGVVTTFTRSHHPALWYITWDPTQPIATRPLALQKDGTWYTCGWDLTKNICEVYRTSGTLGTSYTYTPYGQVSAEGATEQPIQWSSEFNDTELGLIYYNYRHYTPVDGRWTGRDRIKVHNEYIYVDNISLNSTDILGEQRISQLMKTCTRISEERKTAIRNSKHFRGCDINIACEYTRNAVSYANVSGYNITLYIPRCMSDGEIGLLNTLNHELIHLYDNCKLGGIRDCRSFWYGEIRASYFGQCAQIVAESKRKACAIRGAKRSVSYIVKKKLKDKAKDAAFWQPCYPNDKVADKFAENAYIQMKRLPNNPFATL